MKKIYISGRISGLRPDYYINQFFKAHRQLVLLNYPYIVNPLFITRKIDKTDYSALMVCCIKHLFECNAIYMIEGWENSKGARIEHNIAKEMGMEIIYQTEMW